MKFIIVLICLTLAYWTDFGDKLKKLDVSEKCVESSFAWVGKLGIKNPYVALGIFLGISAIIVGLLWCLLASSFGGILGFVFALLVLLYCFGSLDISPKESSDKLMVAALEDIFSITFWFMLAGPVGAIVYRLTERVRRFAKENEVSVAADVFQKILDWIPVRLLTLCFALVGHFSSVMGYWVKHVVSSYHENDQLLLSCADLSYVNKDSDASEDLKSQFMIKLIYRSIIVWLVVLALMILF